MLEDIFRKLLNIPPSQRRLQKDLEYFYEDLSAWRKQLIPWEEEDEIELLSLNFESKWSKQGLDKVLKGRIFSIYHETMLVFAYKSYLKGGKNTILWVRSKKHEWIFRTRKGDSQMYIDGEYVGKITADGKLYGGTKNRLLARRNKSQVMHFEVIVWDKLVAHFLDPHHIDRVNPRAYEVMAELTDREEMLMMGITLQPMIERLNKLNT